MPMIEAEKIARTYFELSNLAKLDEINDLFDDNASYSSNKVGYFEKKDNIMKMMRGFFAGFKSIYWQIDELNVVNAECIEIHFSCRSVGHDGAVVNRTGLEKIIVEACKIKHIEVLPLS